MTSCRESRSPVRISTSISGSASAWVTSVAMMSSASKPSFFKKGMLSASRTSSISGSWLENSPGVLFRFALYSEYSCMRKVWRETSKATATCVGCSSRSTLISIEVKP